MGRSTFVSRAKVPRVKVQGHARRSRWARAAGALAVAAGLTGATLGPGTASAAPQPTAAPAPQVLEQAASSTLPSGNTDYRTLADYRAAMARLVREHPDLVEPLTLPYRTSSGREVRGIEITKNVDVDAGKPVFVTVGMHHGDEWPAGELTMEYAIDLVQSADAPRVSRLLERARVVVVPVVNVDGFVANERRTATGVDMNRNYGYGWLPTSTSGAAPWSEPETRNIKWLLSTRQATTFVTQHTCIQVVLYPPLQLEAGDTQDVSRLHDLASRMADDYGPGYIPRDSAHDYETTGEAIAWAYYATRGLAFTNETCPDDGVPRTFTTEVVDTYPNHRNAMFEALESTADPAQHATIVGKAPKDAVLRVSKSFQLYTQPYEHADGGTRTDGFDNTLTSTLDIAASNGKFRWSVNPSQRPIPPYQADGLHPDQTGFYTEPWRLTCERPDGTVLQTVPVNVGLGETVRVDLKPCKRRFHKTDR